MKRPILQWLNCPWRAPQRQFTRPSFAPKPVLDTRHIRQNPGLYEQNCIDRNYKRLSRNSWTILDLHTEWTGIQQSARGLREKVNMVGRQLGKAAAGASSDESGKSSLLEQARQHKAELEGLLKRETEIEAEIEALALALPNLSSHHTPSNPSDGHKVIRTFNELRATSAHDSSSSATSHVQIGQDLGILDFAAAGTTSGWGWYFLLDEAVTLENALVQYALSVARRRGWRTVSPPSVVYEHMASACGFQPRDQHGETQIYSLANAGEGKPGLCMAGTAEIPFAGMKANSTLLETELPLRIIGASRCYRAEAGARGVDTKGLYRVHEFTKVEMFAWTLPDDSASPPAAEDDDHDQGGAGTYNFAMDDDPSAPSSAQQLVFDEMLAIQTEILTSLQLPGRILEMPASDLGASAQRKVDIEVFFPSRAAAKQGEAESGWGEVTSLSLCGDYQTRRLGTRLRRRKGKKLEWPFTVNGTAMAVPRVLAAVLEHGWDPRAGVVRVPEVLWPWMGGVKEIGPARKPPM